MKRVLVVEDDPIIALDLAKQLTDAGYVVVGPASSAARALHLIRADVCDAAVLDVNLRRETSESIAIGLARLSLPFVTLSGYTSDQHPAAFSKGHFAVRPLRFADLLKALRAISLHVEAHQRSPAQYFRSHLNGICATDLNSSEVAVRKPKNSR